MNIDIERLRCDLIDYFGCATTIYPIAIIDVNLVENADYNRLIEIAKTNGFNLDDYVKDSYARCLHK